MRKQHRILAQFAHDVQRPLHGMKSSMALTVHSTIAKLGHIDILFFSYMFEYKRHVYVSPFPGIESRTKDDARLLD